jgi:predicted acylesterase/phospholipase RssA
MKLILSLDGGGIRGAAISQFLFRIEEKLRPEHDKSIRDCVDFYAGTSTGSIIALALATTDLTMKEINDLYNYETAQQIFAKNKGWFEVDGVNAPKYEGNGKTVALKNAFGTSTIGNVPNNKHVLAVTYALEKRKPVVIKSTKNEYRNLFSYQVADASSAAPTFFPTSELEDLWLIDGAVVANNPTMCAIAEAKQVWSGISLSDLRVLSIGTGFLTRKINGFESQNWGGLQWITKGKIIELLSDERIVSYQCMTLMDQGSYIRVNAKLKPQPGLSDDQVPDDAMDDISRANIKKLKLLGDFWFSQYGNAVIELLIGTYQGESLDRIDPKTGRPIKTRNKL